MYTLSPRQFERLMQLDQFIREGQALTVKALAEVLQVSERTVHHDLDFLRDRFGAPLENNRQKGYFYREDWRLPLVPLTQGELFALVLGSRMLEAASGAAYAQELQSAIDQLVRRMPEKTWVDLQSVVEERIQFGASGLTELNPDFWKMLIEASRDNRTVEMTYYTASRDALSTRKLDPYLLYVYRGTNPYVIGHCHRRKEVRYFRVDRIRELRFTDVSFEREKGFDGRRYLSTVFQVEAGGEPQLVVVRFAQKVAPFIRERRWHRSQCIAEHGDGSLTLSMEVPGLAEVLRWVLGYGAEARVEAPPALVAMVRGEVAKLAQGYDAEGQRM